MRKRFIYICSPLRGDVEKNIEKARQYCRDVTLLCPDAVPIAPHIYCTQFLDDTIPAERYEGVEMGLALLALCDEIWVYGIDHPSEGMMREISFAEKHNIQVVDGHGKIGTLCALRRMNEAPIEAAP